MNKLFILKQFFSLFMLNLWNSNDGNLQKYQLHMLLKCKFILWVADEIKQ